MRNIINLPPSQGAAWQATLLGALLVASVGAQAAGTTAGTTVSNLATLSYSVGGVGQSDIGSSPNGNTSGAGTATTFVVDNKIDLLVTGGQTVTSGVVAGASVVATTFTVKNEGNYTQDFALSITSGIAGDNFDPASCSVSNIAISTGSMGTYTAGDQHINALTPDSVATVTVTCNIPSSVVNGNTGLVALVATAHADDSADTLGGGLTETGAATSGVDIVFADSAGTDDTTGNRDAEHSDRNTYTVTSAVLTVQKTVSTVCDPFNGATDPKNIPGALVKWSITVSNGGGAGSSATLSQITDAIDTTNSSFDADFEQGNSAANCAATANQATSAIGSGFRVSCSGGSRACVSTPAFFTTTTGDDPIANDSGTVKVNFNGGVLTGTTGAALPAEGSYAAGELKAGESVTVEFQAFIN